MNLTRTARVSLTAPALVLAALALGSCASIDIKKLASVDEYTDGALFFAPKPYLLVAETDKGVTTSIVMLPDMDAPRNITWDNGWFGSAKPNFALAGGWNLTGFESESDSGFSAALTAAGGLAGVLGVLDGQAADPFKLIPIVWEGGTWVLKP